MAYDISDPKRLSKVHRFLKKYGIPVQYSVFVAQMTDRNLVKIINGMNSIINEKEDDVRIYPLPVSQDRHVLGKQMFPSDIMLLDGGMSLFLY